MNQQLKNINGLVNKQGGYFKPLSMDIDYDLLDTFTEVSWTQKFINQSSSPVEAMYSLLLPLKTAISRFIVTYDGKKIAGMIKEAEEAVNQYEDSMAAGGSGFLVQKSERTDVNQFNISIGNIPADKEVSIELSFLAVLNDRLDGKMEFEIPIELIPQDLTEISIRGNISITSPVKDIKVNHGTVNGEAVVYQGKRLSTNYVLSFQLVSSLKPIGVMESDPESKSQAIMVTLYPEFPESNSAFFEPKIDAIFVVDRSGSMSGDRIKKTSEALNVLIHALPSDSYFNIVGFGSNEQWLFNESVPYNQANLKTAESLVNGMKADLGGTNLLTPLRSVFSKKKLPDYPRVIFVLTDGEVDDRNSVIAEVQRNKDCFLYGFGIGSGVDQALVKGIAEAGRGKAEFVNSSADIETKVISLFRNALKPALSQLMIDWGCSVTQTPTTIPSAVQGTQLVVFGFIKSGLVSEKVMLTGTNEEGNPIFCPIQISQRKGNSIHKMAAYFLINELYLSNTNNKKEIIDLGLKYQLATKYTSFVAVADNDTPTTDALQIQQITLLKPPELQQGLPYLSLFSSPRQASGAAYPPASLHSGASSGGGGSLQNIKYHMAPTTSSTSWGLIGSPPGGSAGGSSTGGGRGGGHSQNTFAFGGSSTGGARGGPPPATGRGISDPFGGSSPRGGPPPPTGRSGASANPWGGSSTGSANQFSMRAPAGAPGGGWAATGSTGFSANPFGLELNSPPQNSAQDAFVPQQQQYQQQVYSQPQAAFAPPQPQYHQQGYPQSHSHSHSSNISSQYQAYSQPQAAFAPQQPQYQAYSQPQVAFAQQPNINNSIPQSPTSNISSFSLGTTTTNLQPENIKTQIVSSQQFDGSWDDPAVRAILASNTQAALDAKPTNCNQKIWSTALAIAILEIKCPALKSNWDIVANKAKTFMSKYLLTQEKMEREKIPPFVTQLIDKALEALRKLNI